MTFAALTDQDVLVALIGGGATIISAGFGFLAMMIRNVRVSIGQPNGKGNMVQMQERALVHLETQQAETAKQLTQIQVSQTSTNGRVDLVCQKLDSYIATDLAAHEDLGRRFTDAASRIDGRLDALAQMEAREGEIDLLAREGRYERRRL